MNNCVVCRGVSKFRVGGKMGQVQKWGKEVMMMGAEGFPISKLL